jgi:uncharacterized damage-inducible protein DinB
VSDPHEQISLQSLFSIEEFMSKIDLIVDQLKRAFDGEAWHGPALMEALEGIDAETAAAHPLTESHSIWELVVHVAAWERVIIRRIQGEASTLTDEENFPRPAEVSEESWRRAVQALRDTHSELIRIASKLPESRLQDPAPGKDYDLEFMLLGAVQHAAYHGGQIALLKKQRR